jgi:hypothetical protein
MTNVNKGNSLGVTIWDLYHWKHLLTHHITKNKEYLPVFVIYLFNDKNCTNTQIRINTLLPKTFKAYSSEISHK